MGMNWQKLHSYQHRAKALAVLQSRFVLVESVDKDKKLSRLRAWKFLCSMFAILAVALPHAVESEVFPPWLEEVRVSDEVVAFHQRVDKILNPAPFDCVLTGEDKSGSPLALSLRRKILGGSTGSVIDRNPAGSGYVVADPSVSREHARIHVEDETADVEDLNSTNGTSLNDQLLSMGIRSQITDGDELTFGTASLQIKFKK